ncbi:MAG: DEAD/DEAH box helicase [Caldilineaceae bacterium]|nr:DEAD/DEAH box helicase [Caldilineaceae bacterium]
MNFEQFSLDPRILAGVKAAGYASPTPIQQQAIPVVMQGRDVLGLAQTGTGKTAAFMLPILNRLTSGKLGPVRALIIAPTRELAEQIHQTAVSLGKKTKIRSLAIYGGVAKGPQAAALRRGAEIVVACPGRLLDHMNDRTIDLSQVEVLVLDEADRMCDMGFLPDIRRILNQLPKQRQTLFFSATMPDEIRGLADGILQNPVTVQIDLIAPAKTVSHALYPVPEGLKAKLLLAQLQQVATGRVLIFTRTKHRARNLASDLDNRGYRVTALQGNMAQNQRQRAIDGFRRGDYDILVATDIAARGIDVADISHVINFDMPDTADAYIHRSGRTGRAELTGEAITLTVPSDESTVREIERALGTRLERRRLADFDYGAFVPEKQPVAYPSSPTRGNYNARSLNRSTGNGAANRGGQRQATNYNSRQATPNNGGVGESSSSNGNGSGNGANRRRRPSGRYLQR